MFGKVETESGLVEGIQGRDRSLTVFRGIPFAKPPVGDLRWRAPQPPEPWQGVRQAHTFGPVCPQVPSQELAGLDLPMSEDCLHLNVWTGATSADERRPVLVWIYGGGFRMGTGASPRYDGEALARKGVVVVTFNYRLGAFGFLALPELSAEAEREHGHRASGNFGLLDCVAALRWVRDNIAAFGGDPGRVTIAGQSAGAGAVNFLSMSPLADGIFHQSIAQSHARYSRDPELRYLSTSYRSLADAEASGLRWADERGTRDLARLRGLHWRKLIDPDALDAGVDTGSAAKPPQYRPVVDGWVVPAGYDQTYAAGRQNQVRYLAGNNRDESGAVPESTFATYRAAGKKGWRPGMPPVHVTLADYVAAAHEKFGDLAGEFLDLYPASDDEEAARAHNDSVRDNARISTYLWGADWAGHGPQPLFTYFWTHRSPAMGQQPRRASHGSEVEFVFGNLDQDTTAQWTDQDRDIAETMSGYWANFIANGDPNGPKLPHWPAFAPDSEAVMEVGDGFGLMPVAQPSRVQFWKRFFQTQQAW